MQDNARYFITAWHEPIKKSKINAYGFDDEWSRDMAFLAVNSNVFYWLWCVIGDGFDVTTGNVAAMAIPRVPPADTEAMRLRDLLLKCFGRLPNISAWHRNSEYQFQPANGYPTGD